MKSFPPLRDYVPRPPLCRASRQLRGEALPIFIALCTFLLNLRTWSRGKWNRTDLQPMGKRWVSLSRPVFAPSTILLDRTSKADISCIRRLEILLSVGPCYNSVEYRWQVNINSNVEVVDDNGFSDSHDGSYLPEGWIEVATSSLKKIVQEIKLRESPHKLRRVDFEDFRSAVGRAMLDCDPIGVAIRVSKV